MSRSPSVPFAVLLLSVGLGVSASADDDIPEATETEASERRLALMRQCAGEIEFAEIVDGKRRVVPRLPDPVQRFDDVSRNNLDGTVWMWGTSGRPVAVFEIYGRGDGRPGFSMVGHSLSTGTSLEGSAKTGERLVSKQPGLAFRDLPRQPVTSDDAKLRLLQMRRLVRSFDAHEFWDPDNTRYELRMLGQPLHRYSDPDSGILDGAVFAFANGTNPEILLLLEIDSNTRRWRYAPVRMGHAGMHVEFDGEEVWRDQRLGDIPQGLPYWLIMRELADVPDME